MTTRLAAAPPELLGEDAARPYGHLDLANRELELTVAGCIFGILGRLVHRGLFLVDVLLVH
jgi:hypothetical protein